MRLKHWCAIAATIFAGSAAAQSWSTVPVPGQPAAPGTVIITPAPRGIATTNGQLPPGAVIVQVQEMKKDAAPEAIPAPGGAAPVAAPVCDCAPSEDDGPLGPTPLMSVKCLQDRLAKSCNWFAPGHDCEGKEKASCLQIAGWLDFDYTYNSSGPGLANGAAGGPGLAPVMNRFGDEFLVRQLGLYVTKPLDPKCFSLGFNVIAIAGNDAQFLNPTAGWTRETDQRLGFSFTDLNATAHLPILTEGGVDVKAGRQTTVLGPMGALPWQRYFDSSDYEWFNMEEGRYTGVSANWHITKRLSWYNAIEMGGWGVFFTGVDKPSGPDYLGQINYWLDCDAKKTQLTLTVLTGPTGSDGGKNTTAVEATLHQNWSRYVWQVVSFQMNYSKAPLFAIEPPPPGYIERAYAIYTYQGIHLNKCLDLNTRFEWYRDVDGGFYPGGFGTPRTNYYEVTVGFDYHPVKWLQLRPEVRGDFANNDVFGIGDQKAVRAFHDSQLTVAVEALVKF